MTELSKEEADELILLEIANIITEEEMSSWSKSCSWCGKKMPEEHWKKFRGLCVDCFDEAFIEEYGEKLFNEIHQMRFKELKDEYFGVELSAELERIMQVKLKPR